MNLAKKQCINTVSNCKLCTTKMLIQSITFCKSIRGEIQLTNLRRKLYSGLLAVNTQGRSAFSDALVNLKNYIDNFDFDNIRDFFVVPKKQSILVGLDEATNIPDIKLAVPLLPINFGSLLIRNNLKFMTQNSKSQVICHRLSKAEICPMKLFCGHSDTIFTQ